MAKTVSKAATRRATVAPHLQIAHRIEALLRTMRVIERHEEQLCVVMTEIRSAETVTAEARKELKELLEELPSEAYQEDLDAVARALTTLSVEPGKAPAPSAHAKQRTTTKAKAPK